MSAPSWLTSRPIAHRGLHDRAAGRLENTIGAAEAAVAGGYAIECDVQVSSDGEAMVFHDHELDRLTASAGPVRNRTAAELAALPLGGTRDRIPTLTEFLDRIAGRAGVVVEIKSRFDADERLTRRTAEILRGRTDPVVVKSFDPAILVLLRQIAPDLPRGILSQARYDGPDNAGLGEARKREMTELLHWDETRPDFLSWRHPDLRAAAVFFPRRLAGIPVTAWTVRSADEAARALAHADQIVFEGFVPA